MSTPVVTLFLGFVQRISGDGRLNEKTFCPHVFCPLMFSGLEPDMASTQSRPDTMFPEYSSGLDTLPLPLAVCTVLHPIPQKK